MIPRRNKPKTKYYVDDWDCSICVNSRWTMCGTELAIVACHCKSARYGGDIMDIPVKYIQNTVDCHYERPMTLGTVVEDGEDLCRAPQKYRQMCKYCIRDKDYDGKIEEICQLPSEYKSNCNFTPRYREEGKVDVPPEHQTEKPEKRCMWLGSIKCTKDDSFDCLKCEEFAHLRACVVTAADEYPCRKEKIK